MVDFIVKKMKNEFIEMGITGKVTVIATGGMATLIEKGLDCINSVDKLLTLEGLSLIYERNKKG